MIKLAFVVLASFCLLAQAVHQLPSQVADKAFLAKQKNIYELFWHIDQPTVYHPELYQKARSFNIVENVDNFSDKGAVGEFMQLLKHGMLPRGHVFTTMDPEMQHQAVVLCRVLVSAKNFDVFYNTAVWARFHLNEQLYVYSLAVAVLHRQDTKFVKLPPLHEVLPHFFFNEDVIHKAYSIAMGDIAGVKKSVSGVDHYVIPANYSGWYLPRENTPEEKLTYFTEDIGMNAFYFLLNQHFPSFMPATAIPNALQPEIRGEYYFFVHKQLLNRYYLERLANDLGEINYVSVDKPIVTGHYPAMHFHNGLPFPQRETNAVLPLHMQKQVQMIRDLHSRISTAIDIGFAVDPKGKQVNMYTENGLNILGNLVQGNADTINERFYGHLDVLVRKVFGFGLESNDKYNVVPSALEILCTSMRDPVFFSIYKNILSYYHRYKENLPKYETEELAFPGVNVESVTVDKLITYFDTFESLLNNAVSVRSHKEARNLVIKARQYRLNHKPFTCHIVVNSDKDTKAVVRTFLGPKFDQFGHEYDLEHNFVNFMQLDEWIVDLKTGSNTLDRSSHESIFVVPDETPSDVLYKKIVTSFEGTEPFKYSTQPYGIPERLMLPKGKKEGMQFKLFVAVSPFDESKSMVVESPVWGQLTFDGRPMGYPLDRPIESLHFNVPNIHVKDVVIYHKEVEELNVAI